MKLRTIRLEGRKPGGWESAELAFGQHITELFGPNGCGKTPIIQSIAYALGYPVRYRDDILAHCEAAVLTLEDALGAIVEIRRRIKSDFDVEVRMGSERARAFYSEREYSQFLLGVLGFPSPVLTTTGNDATVPYMSTLLPIFYLDQDNGYTGAYRAPQSFIRDQYAEMARLAFGLPPKHSFDQKKRVLEKKKRLDSLDRLIVTKSDQIDELTRGLGKLRRPLDVVAAELSSTTASLGAVKESRGARSDAQVALDALLYEKKSLRRQVSIEVAELLARVRSFNRIQAEIESEVNTLSLNEEARRLFATFKDICENPACGLFLGTSESYGKNLLYLRDQIKDLERNNSRQTDRIHELEAELSGLGEDILALEEKRARLAQEDDTAGLVEAIGELTRTMIALQAERTTLDALAAAEDEYIRLENERQIVQNELASLDGGAGRSDLKSLEIRGALRDRTRRWLDILQTKNVSREISVDADFDVSFGPEKLNQFKGSTLLRVVLALRTAAFEVYAHDASKRLRFLILDTPRQQDIEKDALASYVAELKALAVESDSQVVFSTTDYHYDCQAGDVQWSPEFDGAEQKMFLRSIG